MTAVALWVLVAAPHTVAVDLSALDRQSYQELDAVSLERAVVVRLVQEGFAVVAPSASPRLRIRVTRMGRTVVLGVNAQRAEVQVEPKRLREFHLEAAQKAAELARAADALIAEPPPPAPPAMVEPPPAAREPVPPPAPPEPEPKRWNVLAAGGLLARNPGLDGRVALAGRFAATRSLGLHLEAGVAFATGDPLSAYDASLLFGPGLELTHGTFRLEVGLTLGAMLHVFTLAVPDAQEPQGSRLDFLGRSFLRLTVNPAGGLLVWTQLGAGLTSRAREHRLQGALLYARGALWLDAVIGLGWET